MLNTRRADHRALRSWLRANPISVKRQDATELLEVIARRHRVSRHRRSADVRLLAHRLLRRSAWCRLGRSGGAGRPGPARHDRSERTGPAGTVARRGASGPSPVQRRAARGDSRGLGARGGGAARRGRWAVGPPVDGGAVPSGQGSLRAGRPGALARRARHGSRRPGCAGPSVVGTRGRPATSRRVGPSPTHAVARDVRGSRLPSTPGNREGSASGRWSRPRGRRAAALVLRPSRYGAPLPSCGPGPKSTGGVPPRISYERCVASGTT